MKNKIFLIIVFLAFLSILFLLKQKDAPAQGACVDIWQPGMHCGLTTECENGCINGSVPCQGMNPKGGCPGGFTQLGGDFEAQETYRRFFTCVKN